MTKPTKWVCAQRRFTSARASAQSDQSFAVRMKNLGLLTRHLAHSEDSDQTGWMPRLIWVFAGCTVILLVLSCCGSNVFVNFTIFSGLNVVLIQVRMPLSPQDNSPHLKTLWTTLKLYTSMMDYLMLKYKICAAVSRALFFAWPFHIIHV